MTAKAVPIVLRRAGGGLQVLVFDHPLAGTQLVKGTVEPGESLADACARELSEESGLLGAVCVQDLGAWPGSPAGQRWHFQVLQTGSGLPDAWTHRTADGGGLLFSFWWHPINQPPPGGCHPVYAQALAFVRQRLAAAGGRALPDAD